MLPRNFEKGYTLVEVMIVVAILGLLAAIAVPSYTDNLRRGRRNDAKAKLMQNVQFMESFLLINEKYDVDKGGTAVALPTLVSPAGATGTAVDYNFSFAAPTTSTTYKIQAVPANKMTGDDCGTFTVDNTGARTVSGSLTIADCWYR
ncbi:type IV pilin protein [Undibacterium sp. JH2W]|uniref:type IV pilin protein n=1 Tax=Undibacterium sp. JH2W TaxID=3413037 RepID=UPI003BF32D61